MKRQFGDIAIGTRFVIDGWAEEVILVKMKESTGDTKVPNAFFENNHEWTYLLKEYMVEPIDLKPLYAKEIRLGSFVSVSVNEGKTWLKARYLGYGAYSEKVDSFCCEVFREEGGRFVDFFKDIFPLELYENQEKARRPIRCDYCEYVFLNQEHNYCPACGKERDLTNEDRFKRENENDLRILRNALSKMTKTYRNGNANWVVVKDILMIGTSHSGRTSSIKRCFELGIDPDGKII